MPAKKCPPAGAPEWVLTYGDMMSLLLVFFIMLVAMSELKKEEEYAAAVASVQKAFGMQGGGGKLPTMNDPKLSLMERLEAIALQYRQRENQSNSTDPGVEGREAAVTTIRKGMLFAVGGPITFEPGSAELSEQGKAQIRQAAELVRGFNNKIEVRGHAASMELAESRYTSLWDLSYDRAKAVMAYLTSRELGIRKERVRLIAAADQEPQRLRVYTPSGQTPNRRVEVVVSEELVEDLQPSPDASLLELPNL
jgi:chemotaxis protein MotB